MNVKELEKIREIVVCFKTVLKAKSHSAHGHIINPQYIKKQVLAVFERVKQTPEIKQAKKYLEDALSSDKWERYLYMMNAENLEKEFLPPLEKLIKWDKRDDKIIEEKVALNFREKIEGGDLQAQRKKVETFGTKKKINRLWKIAGLAAGLFGIARLVKKNAKGK